MIIRSATCAAFAAACLIATLPAAHAQTAGTYGTAPGAYGNAPGSYGSTSGTYVPPSPAGAGPTQVLTNGPQASSGDMSPSWSAQQNVRESERYDRLLETSPAFRQARIRKECGPISDPDLRQQCLNSFAQYEPSGAPATSYGSSAPSPSYRSNYGR